MKYCRKVCATVALTLLLALSASGGEIGSPGATSQPPLRPNVTTTVEIGTSGIAVAGDAPSSDVAALEPLTEFTLSLLRGVLSLF